MKLFIFCLVFLSLAIFQQAQAIVPLEVRATLQLPPVSNTWDERLFDLQHCTDDTSFGYAYVSGDTIYWANHMEDEISQFVIPIDSITDYDGEEVTRLMHYQLRLLHLESQGNQLCAFLQSDAYNMIYSGSSQVFCFFNLVSGRLLNEWTLPGSYSYQDHWGRTQSCTRRTKYIIPWPPFPASSVQIAFVQSVISHNETENSFIESSSGTVYIGAPTESSALLNSIEGNHLLSFNNNDQSICVLEGFSSDRVYSGDLRVHTRRWNGIINLTNASVISLANTCDADFHLYIDQHSEGYICEYFQPVPQCGEDGMRRVILNGGYAVNATDFSDTLWHNPAIIGDLHSARLQGCNDERILSYNDTSNSFGIFSANTGEFIDSTSAIQGDPMYFIKHPDRPAELVTFDNTYTVHVYGSLPALPNSANPVADLKPSDFNLSVFPNPFNPSTTLTYTLLQAGKATLKIFDLLGREVTTLASGTQTAGSHSIVWNAPNQPSGIYLSVLEVNGIHTVKKLILIK
jgi:hypothetical protein